MKALLLSAGYGSRLRPLTEHTPKCLVEINGKPLLAYWLELLVSAGIKDILINTHYLSEAVDNYVQESKFAEFITIAYEEELLGTAGTLLKNNAHFVGEPIMLIHADNLSCFSMRDFIKTYDERSADVEITMMTFNTDSPKKCGILDVDSNGIVHEMHEKVENPKSNYANGAVYILSDSIIAFMSSLDKDVLDFSVDVLPNFMGKINTYHNDTYHRDIGDLISLSKAIEEYPKINKIVNETLSLKIL
ncbi:nucleotidyltransferase family protein [Oceanospirillaceae bacterium]|nr:nucleotidyltransferase family protein [bacterium]MDB4214510.1 nucleotidyltransferase family protein [Oceanospirillaceae bacterium]